MAATPSSQMITEPARWAYALREAVGLVRPDWVVTHHDLDARGRGRSRSGRLGR